eukprot:350727-Chlamydomonas_euryale.AAC.3
MAPVAAPGRHGHIHAAGGGRVRGCPGGGSAWSRLLRALSRCSINSSDCSMVLTEKQWFRVVTLCCAVAVINSIDRTAMSIAILPMGETHGWSDTDKGTVSRCVRTRAHMHMHARACVHGCTHVSMRVCACPCGSTPCMPTHACTHACMHACMHVGVRVYMHA